jgi:uncharacterized protein YjbI with pentapeptide repeats
MTFEKESEQHEEKTEQGEKPTKLKKIGKNIKRDSTQLYNKIEEYPLISLFFVLVILLLIVVPHWQVSGINNSTVQTTQENQNRATLAQILGGVAIGIGLYYTWRRITIAEEDLKATQESLKVTQENLRVSQEDQITERFTKAVDQLGAIDHLGNPAIEIRLGGIYALERIASESKKDYLPIIEILTSYVRKNSCGDSILKNGNISMDIQSNESTKHNVSKVRKISPDIQAILTVLGRLIKNGEPIILDLRATCLEGANLFGAHFEGANLFSAHFEGANLRNSHFEGADLNGVHFEGADFDGANLEGSKLNGAYFKGANLGNVHLSANMKKTDLHKAHFEGAEIYNTYLEGALLQETHFEGVFLGLCHLENAFLYETHLEGAKLRETRLDNAALYQTHLEGADLKDVHLEGAELIGTHLEGAKNLTIDQLSKVKTLYNAKIDNVLLIALKENYPILFEKPTQISNYEPETVYIDTITSPSIDFFKFRKQVVGVSY